MSADIVAFPAARDRAGRASPEPLSAQGLGHSATIANAADTPITRAIDQLFANQGQRIAGLMGETK